MCDLGNQKKFAICPILIGSQCATKDAIYLRGFRPFIYQKQISSKELEGKARTRPDILMVFLGPYVQ